jgi:hypothetical protein
LDSAFRLLGDCAWRDSLTAFDETTGAVSAHSSDVASLAWFVAVAGVLAIMGLVVTLLEWEQVGAARNISRACGTSGGQADPIQQFQVETDSGRVHSRLRCAPRDDHRSIMAAPVNGDLANTPPAA